MQEKNVFKMDGILGLLISFALFLAGFGSFIFFDSAVMILLGLLLILTSVIMFSGITVVNPNEATVVVFFGKYKGVIKESGFWLTIPLSSRKKVSLRVSNFDSNKLKVNDAVGNPIEIAAIVVYKVVDPTKATFNVEDYKEFVQTQSETGIRHIASLHPYDDTDGHPVSLRGNSDEVAEELKKDLQERMGIAGVEIIEARIMHLAYAPEIAHAMLQKQQAQAILASRKIIVEGAVTMVKEALEKLQEEGVVELDDERKATMINNLMVAIVSDRSAQPIINTGTVY